MFPHLMTTLIFEVFRKFIQYLSHWVAESTLDDLSEPVGKVTFSLEPIFQDVD